MSPTEDVEFNLDCNSSHYMIVIILSSSMASYLISQHALFPRRPTEEVIQRSKKVLAFPAIASPQTAFGVRLSRIHFSTTTV